MQVDVGSLVTKVQELVEDPTGQWCTKNYMLGVMNLIWDDLSTELSMLNLGYDEVIAVLDNVPAGTTSLGAYQAQGQPLANMIRPKLLEWKMPLEQDTSYQDVDPVDRLPDVEQGTLGVFGYTFKQQVIQVTPSSQPVTLRVTFLVMNVTLMDDNDSVIAGAQNVMAYRVASKVQMKRGNPQLSADNTVSGDKAMANFELLCCRLKQRQMTRFARTTRRPSIFGQRPILR